MTATGQRRDENAKQVARYLCLSLVVCERAAAGDNDKLEMASINQPGEVKSTMSVVLDIVPHQVTVKIAPRTYLG